MIHINLYLSISSSFFLQNLMLLTSDICLPVNGTAVSVLNKMFRSKGFGGIWQGDSYELLEIMK